MPLTSATTARLWAIVPAAGTGRRMGSDIPKQYLRLAGRTVLEHSLAALDTISDLAGLMVVIAPDDQHWPRLQPILRTPLMTASGGTERADSVVNALAQLALSAAPDDWVLVHDAARPCVRTDDLKLLVSKLLQDPVGGLLATPVRDTMKQADAEQRCEGTPDRARLWHALTPQMFRIGMLREALMAAQAAGIKVTDEASAMESVGHRPQLIEGHPDNLKITRPDDLALAEFYLTRQGRI